MPTSSASEHYHRAIKAHRLAEAFEETMRIARLVGVSDWQRAAEEASAEFWERLAKVWNADHPGRKINPPSTETIQATLGILQARHEERDGAYPI